MTQTTKRRRERERDALQNANINNGVTPVDPEVERRRMRNIEARLLAEFGVFGHDEKVMVNRLLKRHGLVLRTKTPKPHAGDQQLEAVGAIKTLVEVWIEEVARG